MLRFEHSTFLYLLFLLILIGLVFIAVLAWKRRAIRKFGDKDLVAQLFTGYSPAFFRLKFWLLFFGFAFIVLGAANLQMGDKLQKITKKGVDVMVALDVSNSMLAQDVQPDRLTRAKQLVSKLMQKIPNDRIGLVVFAGNAYLQMPLTVDFSAARMYLNTIDPGMIPTQGTAIDEAIARCQQAFNKNEQLHKSIVLISDGEDWSEEGIEAAKKAHDAGVVISTVGVGSVKGAPIRDPKTGEYMKDKDGKLVLTHLNEDVLKAIAKTGNGIYQHLNNTDKAVAELTDQLGKMQKKTYGENLFANYKSYFQYFIALGLLLLLVEFFIPETIKKEKVAINGGA